MKACPDSREKRLVERHLRCGHDTTLVSQNCLQEMSHWLAWAHSVRRDGVRQSASLKAFASTERPGGTVMHPAVCFLLRRGHARREEAKWAPFRSASSLSERAFLVRLRKFFDAVLPPHRLKNGVATPSKIRLETLGVFLREAAKSPQYRLMADCKRSAKGPLSVTCCSKASTSSQ